MSKIYDPSSTTTKITTIEYSVMTIGDHFFIPVNSDVHGDGDGDGDGDMADQLAQCKVMTALGVKKVVS